MLNFLTTFFLIPFFAAHADCAGEMGGLVVPELAPKPIRQSRLATLDLNKRPWTYLDGEQPFMYIGSTPREMALGMPLREKPILPTRLKALAEKELERVRTKLGLKSAEFEMWPAFDDWGSTTWAVARYRESPRHDWKWLDNKMANPRHTGRAGAPTGIVLPEVLDPANPESRDRIFNHFPSHIGTKGFEHTHTSDDLYQRPEFQTIIWTTPDLKQVYGAWQKYEVEGRYQMLCGSTECRAISLPPPARFNQDPTSFVLRADYEGVHFPKEIEWEPENRKQAQPRTTPLLITEWPSDFVEEYKKDLKRFSGETKVYAPGTRRLINFKKQSSAESGNDLLKTADYLIKRGQKLGFGKKPGFEVELQKFDWHKIPQANVILRIKGRLPKEHNLPVVASGHYDKAIAEDTYEASGGTVRQTTPGADDNGTAVASLLRAAEVLEKRYRDSPPERDIEIVFFTGEEFPTGTLGARYYVNNLLNEKRDITANLNIDMIGHRTSGDRVFQLNPSASLGSWETAEIAYGVANQLAKDWDPKVRHPWSKQSFEGQTDTTVFGWAGYRGLLFSEHINLRRRLNPTYHQSDDLAENIDLPYATTQAKIFIETIAQLAEQSEDKAF